MERNPYKELLTDLGCLAGGRFVCPPSMREYHVMVSLVGGGHMLTVSQKAGSASSWSYTDDFIIYRDGKGHTAYYAWSGVASVTTNPM